MGCPRGGPHDYQPEGRAYICSKCSQVAPYKPMLSYEEVLEAYGKLMEMCQQLAMDEISLNNFKVFVEGLE